MDWVVGFDVGALLGAEVGLANGFRDISAEGLSKVALDGCEFGRVDGLVDGGAEGLNEFASSEEELGRAEGLDVGALVGEEVGFSDSLGDGSAEGLNNVPLDGRGLGRAVGLGDGSAEEPNKVPLDGRGLGRVDGLGDGSTKRLADGALVGEELGFAYEVSSEAEGLDDVDDRTVEGLDDGNVLVRTGGVVVGLIEMLGDTVAVVEIGGRDGFFVGEVLAAIEVEVDGPGGDEGVELGEFDTSEDDDGVCDGARNCCCKVGFGDCPE
jgi:hypothetical protein